MLLILLWVALGKHSTFFRCSVVSSLFYTDVYRVPLMSAAFPEPTQFDPILLPTGVCTEWRGPKGLVGSPVLA